MVSLGRIFSLQKSDSEIAKLYEKEKSTTKVLMSKIDYIYRSIQEAAGKSRSKLLKEALSQEHKEEGGTLEAVRILIKTYDRVQKDHVKLDEWLHDSEEQRWHLENQLREVTEDLGKQIIDMITNQEAEAQQRDEEVSQLKNDKIDLAVAHRIEVGQLKEEYREEKEKTNARIAKMSDKFVLDKGELNAKMSQMTRDFNAEKDRMNKDFKAEKEEMNFQFNDILADMEQSFEKKQAILKGHIESLSGALLDRDHFKSLTDHDLKQRFLDLKDDIDIVAGSEWQQNRTEWTNEFLGLSQNRRKFKKYILQERIWAVLEENIFCSPFRVFGEEGRSLETEWQNAFGQDYQPENGSYAWPEASLDAERWRYEAIKQCQEALEQRASKYDPRAVLKNGFESSLNIVNNKLSETIGKISDVDNMTVKKLEDVTKKAAEMWLEFGTQRCRLLVVMSRSNLELQPSERIRKARLAGGGSLELVTLPELQRLGNSDGQDLTEKQTVAGCEGTIERVKIGDSR